MEGRMRVGVNYPWLDYGWDFGLGPPAWRGARTTPRWFDHVDEHLARLRDLGISVVRWFLLADGLTYGTGDEAPRPAETTAADWRFDPPALEQDLLDHFDELLRRFGSTATATAPPIQLIPVLIDFHFCEPGMRPVEEVDPLDPLETRVDPGWVKQGRGDAIRDPAKRSRFLSAVLDPLLGVSALHRDTIFAWELINEPDLITRGWHPNPFAHPPIPEPAMREFLEDGKQRIRAAGFKPTIGFASVDTLQRSGVTAEINQFHYYPDGKARLGEHVFDPRFPGIIGEFATDTTDVWPDLTPGPQGVAHRLKLAEERGYPLAIPWSFLAEDRHTAWSAVVEEDIRAFTQRL
jgi:hypothetical protein